MMPLLPLVLKLEEFPPLLLLTVTPVPTDVLLFCPRKDEWTEFIVTPVFEKAPPPTTVTPPLPPPIIGIVIALFPLPKTVTPTDVVAGPVIIPLLPFVLKDVELFPVLEFEFTDVDTLVVFDCVTKFEWK